MKRAFGVVCIICIIYLAALMVGFYKYELNAQNEIEQLLLSYTINYSADGAMNEALNIETADIEHPEYKSLKMNPNSILDSFLDIFCISYDIGTSTESKEYVTQNFIPMVCVAGFDGYYIAKVQPVKSDVNVLYPSNDKLVNSRWDLVFGPKMPYAYKGYALNMGMDYTFKLIHNPNEVKYEKILGLVPGLQNKQAGITEINKILTKAIASSINNANSTNNYWDNLVNIPLESSAYSGINPIKGPSLIILVQNVDLRTSKPISGFSISGSKIEKARKVVGYIRNGIKYYCYKDIAPGTNKIDGALNISEEFWSINAAAEAGYYCDLKYMD